jgi:phosphate transport system ATP-binding protein
MEQLNTMTEVESEVEIASEPVISIRNLRVTAGKSEILKGIDLDIPKNGITVLLGPSGCGKTTLLKCLNRLTDLHPELEVTGSIKLHDSEILDRKKDITALRLKMGLVSQRPYPLPMSIFDNVAYGMKLKGESSKRVLELRVEKYLRKVALWDEVKDRLNESAYRLSIGQQQRLCLARGLAVEPEVILADEPTSALDPISSAAIEAQFIELRKEYSLVMVTHMLRQAKRLADHVVFMYYGEIIEQGNPDELFNNPKSAVLKNYLTSGH